MAFAYHHRYCKSVTNLTYCVLCPIDPTLFYFEQLNLLLAVVSWSERNHCEQNYSKLVYVVNVISLSTKFIDLLEIKVKLKSKKYTNPVLSS